MLSIDSTFISNKYGTEKIGRNIFYKSKNGIKITTIVDSNGIPLDLRIDSGNTHDSKIAPKILNNLKNIDSKINNQPKNKYLLADKGYDSQKIREIIKTSKYIPLIAKRKTNNKAKRLTKKENVIYKKRIIIEHSYSWLKMNAKIEKLYEKTIKSYKGLLLLAISILIFNRC